MALSNLAVVAVHVGATVDAATDETWEMMKTPSWVTQGEIIEAWYSDSTGLTGHATNYTTLSIFNVTDSVALASRAVDTATTDDITADTPWEITVSTTVANTKVTANEAVRARKVDAGTGMAVTIPATFQAVFFLNGTYN